MTTVPMCFTVSVGTFNCQSSDNSHGACSFQSAQKPLTDDQKTWNYLMERYPNDPIDREERLRYYHVIDAVLRKHPKLRRRFRTIGIFELVFSNYLQQTSSPEDRTREDWMTRDYVALAIIRHYGISIADLDFS